MNQDDLLRMLDIKPERVQSVPVTVDPTRPNSDRTTSALLSPYALELDEWDIDRGRQCLVESRHFDDLPWAAQAAADFHAVYWQTDPTANPDALCQDPNRAEFLKMLVESPEYRELHHQTRHNPFETMIAAGKLAQAFAKVCQAKEGSNDTDKDGNVTPSDTGAGMGIEHLMAVHQAVKEAQAEVDSLRSMQSACGWDMSAAVSGKTDTAQMMRHFESVKNNDQLRRIMELAGKYRRCAQSKQRSKMEHGQDEFVGVTQDNDVSRLLPVELGRLGDEDLELDMLRRFAERQTMCREYVTPEPQGHGPIVVCLDESGSMRGEKIAQAKAFALAMAWVARHQNRYCLLVAFSNQRDGRVLCLPPTAWNQDDLMNWLSGFEGGGTSLECPLSTVPNSYWSLYKVPSGKTDMLLITDGIVEIDSNTSSRFIEWKKDQRCQLTTLVIGAQDRGSLGVVSDKVHSVSNFNLKDSVVQDCMSL